MTNEERFNIFWEHYPRREPKKPTKEKFMKYMEETDDPDALLEAMLRGIERQKPRWTSKEFTPMASTWMNQKRWEDEEDMRPDEATDIGRAIILLAQGFGYSITRERLEVYKLALKDVPPEALIEAFKQILFEDDYFPSLARIIKTIRKLPSAYEAWEEVTRMVNQAFVYKEPVFSNPVIERAVKVIGWRNLCTLYSGDLNTTRAHFFKVYESLSNRVNVKTGGELCLTNIKRIMNTDTLTQAGLITSPEA